MIKEAQARRWRVAIAVLAVSGTVASAQSRTAPVGPDAGRRRLEIGPVTGLTTVWHRAPHATAVPLGASVELRVRAPRPADVRWSGTREVRREVAFAVARVRFDRPGPHPVRVVLQGPAGEPIVEAVGFEVVDLGARPIRVTDLRLSADEVVVDPDHPNASSMRSFFRQGSIARLTEESPGYYLTSIERWVTAAARVEPAGFGPLLEWRLDGKPLAQLGAQIQLESFVARPQVLEAGGETMTLETYRVHITNHESRAEIRDGEPVTFTAVTEPPGYESRITWLASTKYGTSVPAMGEGGEFTVRFEGTAGPAGRWLGVVADERRVSADAKAGVQVGPFECPPTDPEAPFASIGPCLVNPSYDCKTLDPRPDFSVDLGQINCGVFPDRSFVCNCTAVPGSFPACDRFIASCAFASGDVAGDPGNATCSGQLDPPPPSFPPPPPPPPPSPPPVG